MQDFQKRICQRVYASIANTITDREKDIFFLSVVYFWARYWRRNRLNADFRPQPPTVNPEGNPFIELIRMAIQVENQLDADHQGSTAQALKSWLQDHQQRATLVHGLTDKEIGQLFNSLEAVFSNQLEVSRSEANDLFAVEPEAFAFGMAAFALSLFMIGDMLGGYPIRIRWFENVPQAWIREGIIEAAFMERLADKTVLELVAKL